MRTPSTARTPEARTFCSARSQLHFSTMLATIHQVTVDPCARVGPDASRGGPGEPSSFFEVAKSVQCSAAGASG
jgi:hypothetical protein